MRRFIVRIHWPAQKRTVPAHGYNYLVLAGTEAQAVARVENRWKGLTGGTWPHTVELIAEAEEVDLFELSRIPWELSRGGSEPAEGGR